MQKKPKSQVLVTYEEDNATTTAYKFPIDRHQRGTWVQALPRVWYRVTGNRIQVFDHAENSDPQLVGEIERFLRGLDPIQNDYVLEIEIGHDGSGFFLQEVGFDDECRAARIKELTRSAFVEALRQVSPG